MTFYQPLMFTQSDHHDMYIGNVFSSKEDAYKNLINMLDDVYYSYDHGISDSNQDQYCSKEDEYRSKEDEYSSKEDECPPTSILRKKKNNLLHGKEVYFRLSHVSYTLQINTLQQDNPETIFLRISG